MNRVIKFGSANCGPCKTMKPMFEKFAAEIEDGVEVIELDVDESSQEAEKYGIQSIPTTIFIKDDKVAKIAKGVITTQGLHQTYNKIFK